MHHCVPFGILLILTAKSRLSCGRTYSDLVIVVFLYLLILWFLLTQALRFLGLLSGSSSKYMPILFADKASVLTDLPATLPSLLAGAGSEIVAESVASCLLRATERVQDWARCAEHGHYLPNSQPINSTEEGTAMFMLRVMHQTCVNLKEYLPVDKQLTLANMVVA